MPFISTTRTAGAPAVLQVVSTTSTSSISTSNTTFTDSGISVTITPSSATSKIFLSLSGGGFYLNGNGQSCAMNVTFYRNSTNVAGTDTISYQYVYAQELSAPHSVQFIDSPATTSAITYKIYFSATNAARQVYLNLNPNPKPTLVFSAWEISA